MPSTCELKSKQLWAGNEEKCISFSQLQLRDQTTGVAVRSVPPSSHPSNVSISQPTWQQSVPHHTTHQNRTDKTNRPWAAAIPELPTPNSQLPNLKSQILLIMRRTSTARPPAVYQQRAAGLNPLFAKARQKKEVRTHQTLAHRARHRLSETAQSLSSSQVRLGWVGWYLFC